MTPTPSPPILDLRNPAFRHDPHPALAALRAAGPLHRDPLGIAYVVRHAEVAALIRDPRLGRDLRRWPGYALIRPFLADSPLEACAERWLLMLDPPDHTRLRALAARAFAPRSLDAMRATIERAVDELLDAIAPDEPFDAVERLALPLPVTVIARILSLPVDDLAAIKRWSADLACCLEPAIRRRDQRAASGAAEALTAYLRRAIAAHAPDGGLLDTLLAHAADGDRLADDELLPLLVLLFVAGHETTTSLIAGLLDALVRHPDALARVRADPRLVPAAVEEALRWDGPVNVDARVALEPVAVGDVTLRPGELVMCMLGAANRDPAVFPDPDRFDPGRAPNPHVAFGGGPHYCLGAHLARLEARIAVERALARWPRLDRAGEPARLDRVNLRGFAALPLAWRR